MPLRKNIVGSAADWLARAKGDLALARIQLPEDAFFEDLCYHAQQAAEKAIKAVYVYRQIKFNYIHDLSELLNGLKKHDIEIPPEVDAAAELTVFAWEARYPGPVEPVTEQEYQNAVKMASLVVEWATKEVLA
ncbi:HEPN domain-containing protein [candidate division KSB1 bacterium]|nr:HEPN domain-containing protein [candidate division KSB1 bacterium]